MSEWNKKKEPKKEKHEREMKAYIERERDVRKMRLFVASENKRLIIKLIFNVQCTLNKSSVCLAVFGFHCIHLQRWIWCCMQLQQDGFKRVARNGCFNVDISTRELATSSEILISNHFHKLRISIQAYAKREKNVWKKG